MDKNERLPTIKQLDLYKLIHPDFGGMTIEEAAKQLNITIRAAYSRIKRLKERCSKAFRLEEFIKKEEEHINSIENIYAGYKTISSKKNLQFTISLEDMVEIIQLECSVCGQHPSRANREYLKVAYNHKNGYKFPYNHLWRYDVTKGYTYINCVPICSKCAERRRDNARG